MISPEQVHEKRWLKAPEMAETSSAQSAKQRSAVSNLHVQKYKSLKAEKIFFGMNAQNIFFQLPNLKKDIVRDRIEVATTYQVKTKQRLRYESSGALQAT